MGLDMHYNVIIIGSGPAGQSAAIGASKNGLSVLIVEEMDSKGGNCAFNGTIPSKALRESVSKYKSICKHQILSSFLTDKKLTLKHINSFASSVISKQVNRITTNISRNNIDTYKGTASFTTPNSIMVESEGQTIQYTADNIVIATGSSPYHPEGIDFSHQRMFDSSKILTTDIELNTITIYGAGVIGSEYASIFSSLGVKVTLINPRKNLLEFLDCEISSALEEQLIKDNVEIIHGLNLAEITHYNPTSISATLSNGTTIKSDAFLFTNGRSGNTGKLKLDAIGLSTDSRGLLSVNSQYQTQIPSIYAIGDVIGYPSLASTSFEQGRVVGEILSMQNTPYSNPSIPTGIYTIPEISSVGMTEKELQDSNIKYESGRSHFKNLARSHISGCETGFLKILFCPDTLKLLGVHCFCEQASEIIHIGQSILSQEGKANTIEYFISKTFNYPTNAEAYREAALNGINKLQ